jgi:DNA-binding Xre family transcriptional regulator
MTRESLGGDFLVLEELPRFLDRLPERIPRLAVLPGLASVGLAQVHVGVHDVPKDRDRILELVGQRLPPPNRAISSEHTPPQRRADGCLRLESCTLDIHQAFGLQTEDAPEGRPMSLRVPRATSDASLLTTGQRLSKLMADRGVTSGDLAANLRIQESTLANFQRGFRGIPSDVIVRMAKELGTNVAFLLTNSEDARPAPPTIEAP